MIAAKAVALRDTPNAVWYKANRNTPDDPHRSSGVFFLQDCPNDHKPAKQVAKCELSENFQFSSLQIHARMV
jgi:hypothetical protein